MLDNPYEPPQPPSASGRMKTVAILWNLMLGGLAVYGLARWAPSVYEQAHYQFTNPHGGNSMWPVTFEMILFLVAFLASLIALSYLFNRTLGIVARAVAATLTLLLVVAWVTNTVLWMQDGMPGSMFGRMWNFDGLPFIAVALYSLGTSAVLGHGPITVGMKWLRKIPLKKE